MVGDGQEWGGRVEGREVQLLCVCVRGGRKNVVNSICHARSRFAVVSIGSSGSLSGDLGSAY